MSSVWDDIITFHCLYCGRESCYNLATCTHKHLAETHTCKPRTVMIGGIPRKIKPTRGGYVFEVDPYQAVPTRFVSVKPKS